MTKTTGFWGVAVLLVFASVGFAQYTMTLTGLGDGATFGGVFVSPYWGTIQGNGVNYTGYMICDDYATHSELNQSWNATGENATNIDSGVKFDAVSYHGHTAQEGYDAVAYLASQLMSGSNFLNYNAQVNYSYAIWDVMNPGLNILPNSGGTLVQNLINTAFLNTASGYSGPAVTVFTPYPNLNASQEFLVVGGPAIATPEPAAAAVLGFDLLSLAAIVFFMRRHRVRA